MAIMHIINLIIYSLSTFETYYVAGMWYIHDEQYTIKAYAKIFWLYFDPLKLFHLECLSSPICQVNLDICNK